MRYVNLKKRKTSNLENSTKKFAFLSIFVLIFVAILVVPFNNKLETANAELKQENLQLENNVVSNDGMVNVVIDSQSL